MVRVAPAVDRARPAPEPRTGVAPKSGHASANFFIFKTSGLTTM